jgi:CspA family cold shock protein
MQQAVYRRKRRIKEALLRSEKVYGGKKMKGKVKFFNTMKGFGFIAGDDGKEYFVHQTGLEEGVRLNENDAVVFEVTQGDRGPKAEHVKKDSGDSEEPAEESEESSEETEEETEEEQTE